MKEQLKLLRDLQSIDLELDSKRTSMGTIQQQLADHKSILEKLTVDLEIQRGELSDTIALKVQRDDELAEAEERTGRSKERLMNVSSAKEYNALDKEIESLNRKSEETREQLDHLREAIEVAERSISEKQEKIDALREQIDLAERDAEGQLDVLAKDIEDTSTRREEARDRIKRPVMRRYDFIRTRRSGTALVPGKGGACQGCFMMLPPQLYIELQRGVSLISCPSCQRILFFEPEDLSATT